MEVPLLAKSLTYIFAGCTLSGFIREFKPRFPPMISGFPSLFTSATAMQFHQPEELGIVFIFFNC